MYLKRLFKKTNVKHNKAGLSGNPDATGFASLSVLNTDSGTSTAPNVRFAHVFKQGDVPSGSIVSIKQSGVAVPYTAARRSTWPDGSLRVADFLCKLPSNISGSGTATLDFRYIAGSYDDTLPNSKSVSDIVTDITTNHDTIKMEVSSLTNSSGGTEGSGTWIADSTTAFGLTNYRSLATGPTACDLVVWMKIKDGSTDHDNLWCQWYITAFLDTVTGAVTKLCWRAWLNQGYRTVQNDKYTYQGKLKLGNTVVRSWGFAADSRTLNFSPSNVNTSTNQITLTGHGFVSGELVRFTTSGTLPSGISLATDYWTIVDDANTIRFAPTQSTSYDRSAISLSTQGSGVHTITGYINHNFAQRQCWADRDGLWDWHSGITGALNGEPTVYPIHDKVYYRSSKMAPPLDFSYDFLHTTEVVSSDFVPNSFGRMNPLANTSGANISYGAPWNEWGARAYRYRNDRLGYVKTLRAHALMKGTTSVHWVRDDTTFRIPVLNNGSDRAGAVYSGLGSCLPNSFSWAPASIGFSSSDWPLPKVGTFTYNYTHHYTGPYPLYIFEGGADVLQLLYGDANGTIAAKFPPAGDPNAEIWDNAGHGSMILDRCAQFGGGTRYYRSVPWGEPRADAWVINLLTDAYTAGGDTDSEKLYLKDVLDDTLFVTGYIINTWGGSGLTNLGGWFVQENAISISNFMQSYLLMAWSFAYMRHTTADMLVLAAQQAQFYKNLWVNSNCHSFSNIYSVKTKDAAQPNTGWDSYSTLANLGLWGNAGAATAWSSDGRSISFQNPGDASNNSYLLPQDGDRIFLTDSFDVFLGFYDSCPPELSLYTWYYARQCSGQSFKLATTNSDGTIIGSVTPNSSTTTLASNINNSTLSIPLTAPLTFPSGPNVAYMAIRIGSEMMRAVASTTTTVTLYERGSGNTTPASHTAGDTVEVLRLCTYYTDVHMRNTGCPVTGWNAFPGSAAVDQFGYLTMARAGMGYAYVAGTMNIDGYNIADAYWQVQSGTDVPSVTGPQGAIDQSSIMHSVSINI